MASRGCARSGSRHGFCANSRRCVRLHAGLDSRHGDDVAGRRIASAPPPTADDPVCHRLHVVHQSSDRRAAVGSDPRVEGGGGEIQEWELMNRGSLRPSVHARHRHRCPPRACHDANSSAASLGLHCVVTPFLPRESAGKPLLLATADACPRGLGCMFRRLRGHMVRCARGRAGRRNARQTCPGFSALLPTGRGGKQTTAQSANHHHVVGRAGGTVSGRRSVLRH